MYSRILLLIGILCLICSEVLCQTGPGGIGNQDGSDGQAQNILWLDANTLGLGNGAGVTLWEDQSGNGNHLTQLDSYNVPVFRNDGLSSLSHRVVRFDGTERYLHIPDNGVISGIAEISILLVYKPTALGGSARGILSKRISSSNQEEYSLFSYSNNYLNFDIRTNSDSRSNSDPVAVNTTSDFIVSAIYNGSNKSIYLQTELAGTPQSKTGGVSNGTADLIIGALNESYGTYFSGDIAEIILYNKGLNNAERVILENYFSEKYGIVVTNDFFTASSSDYNSDIVGIGSYQGDTHEDAASGGMTMKFYDGSFGDGDFLFSSHRDNAVSIVSDSLEAGMVERWSRNWYVDKTGSINVSLGFDFGDGIGGLYPQDVNDYRLIRRNGSTYEEVTYSSVYVSDDQLIFNVEDANLTDGFYGLATVNTSTAPLLGGAQRVWYSYKSGNWGDPLNWTLDGAVTPQYVNPSNEIPNASDRIVITAGKQIQMLTEDGSMNLNSVSASNVNLTGILDLGSSYGHIFDLVDGDGVLRIEGSSVDDSRNLPDGDLSLFTGTTGGTVQLTGDGMSLNGSTTINNLRIDLDGESDVVTLTGDLLLNGDFTIDQGTFQINNASTIAKNIDLYGNLYVGVQGNITTGTGDARHEFNFYGDFTNDGEIAFTQRTSQVTNTEATDGIVDANFLNDTDDQTVQCNNTTHFYRIEIDKGEDDTYVLNLEADDPGYFNLNGYANNSHGETAQLTTNSNALGLLKGTVRVGNNVIIAALNTGGNYNINEKARLWIDGGSATKPGGTAIVPYGGILVTNGTLTSSINSGITTRGNGYLEVQGGKVLINQFRTSIYGVSNQGGYRQTGGEVYVSGGSTSTDYYAFSLTYEGNTFEMSGGLLTINSNSRGGIFINGSEGNFNITGGEVICELDNNSDFVLTSKAPFYNLSVRKTTNNSGYVILDGGTSANGSSDPRTLLPQTLRVIKNFRLYNNGASYVDFGGVTRTTGYNASFDANDVDMEIGGNLRVQNGVSFSTGDNTITFNGGNVSLLSFGTGATQSIHNMVLDKDFYDQGVRIIAGNSTSVFETNGSLSVNSGKLFIESFNVTALGDVYVTDSIGKPAATGRLIMSGPATQTIFADGGSISNLEVINSNGVSLDGDLSIRNTLYLTTGVFDVGTYKLSLVSPVNGTGFGISKMIQTAGNASDGGLEIYIDGASTTETLFYPIGTNRNASTRYTPVATELVSISDDGFLKFSLADAELNTTDLSGGDLMSYYWRSTNYGFATAPIISEIVFSYDQADVVGDESSYVPGKVQSTGDYLRSFESDGVDAASNTITFDDGFAMENFNFTAGISTRFVGSPRIFYTADRSYVGGGRPWSNGSTWSTVGHFSTSNPGSEYPQEGDIAVLGFSPQTNDQSQRSHWVFMDIDVNVAQLLFSGDSVKNGSGNFIQRNASYTPRLIVDGNRGSVDFGVVSGQGSFSVEVDCSPCNSNPDLSVADLVNLTADFGDFSNTAGSRFDFVSVFGSGFSVKIPTYFPEEYPGLHIISSGSNRRLIIQEDILVRESLVIRQDAILQLNSGPEGDIEVLGDFNFTVNDGSDRLEFPTSGNERTLTIHGDVIMRNGDNDRIIALNNTPSNLTHTLRVGGSIEQNSGNTIDLFNGNSGDNNVVLELFGPEDGVYTTSDNNMELYRLVINKGMDTTSTFTFLDEFSLNGLLDVGSADSLPLEIISGMLILDNTLIDLTLAQGNASFVIPESGGLEVSNGTIRVEGDNTGIILNGNLTISGGVVDLDDTGSDGNNFIEYGSSGNANIDVSSGQMIVGSQIRRVLTSTSGVLNYLQTGGDVIVGKNAAPQTTRGVFEIANSSDFTFTGGTMTIVRGINSLTVPTLLVEPTSYDLLGSTIIIGNADTPSGNNSSRIGIKSSIPLNNLTIDNSSSNDPIISLYSRSLTIDGTLSIDNGSTLNAKAYNLTLNGDFNNDGIYLPSGNTTTFSSESTQSFAGTGSTNFYNLVKSNSGQASISNDITVENELNILAGVFEAADNAVYVSGDVTLKSTLNASSGEGLVFGGLIEQLLIGKNSVNASIGIMTINNASGVRIPDGNGYSFTISNNLRLQSGLFNIGGSLLTIGQDAEIEEVSTFSNLNMIQTNSSFTDNGVKKVFSGAESSFIFPVGDIKYTPVDLHTITAIDEDATITVRPANESHPAVTDDVSTPAFDETENVLLYHWVVKSEGMTGLALGSVRFYYDQGDVSLTGGNTESDYIAARLTVDSYQWDKAYSGSAIDVIDNTISIPLDQSGIFAGEYTAGITTAFRDVPEYRSTGDVNFTSISNWEVSSDGGSSWGEATVEPAGARVTVRSGDELEIDDDFVRLLSMTIEANARLYVNASFNGSRIGEVFGTGTLVLESEVLPSGNYEAFFTCSGGDIEYISNNSYQILSGIPNVRKVTLYGTGNRTVASNSVIICEDLVIDGPSLIKDGSASFLVEGDLELISGGIRFGSTNANLTVDGNTVLTAGSFQGYSGADITFNGDLTRTGATFSGNSSDFVISGNTLQTITGSFSMNKLTVNNSGAGVDLMSGNLTILNTLRLLDGLIATSSSNLVTLGSTASWTGAGVSSHISGPMTKNGILSSGTFSFPVGKAGRYAPVSVSNVQTGGQNWTAEYFTDAVDASIPTTMDFETDVPDEGYSSLLDIQENDRWSVASSGTNSSYVRVSYGAHNSFGNKEEICIVWWDAVDGQWENQGANVNGTTSSGTVASQNAISFSTQQFGLGVAPSSALPVELVFFNGRLMKNGNIQLEWQTASELNNEKFMIERSANGLDFETIGSVAGAENSDVLLDYSFVDRTPDYGINYYRLKQVDFDGVFEYSSVIAIMNDQYFKGINAVVYPNPADKKLINVLVKTGDQNSPIEFTLFDLMGKEFLTETIINHEIGETRYSVVPQGALSSGIYLLYIQQSKNSKVIRVIVQ